MPAAAGQALLSDQRLKLPTAALADAAFAGMAVVRVGRGNTCGTAYRTDPLFIVGDNLAATKARMLLMAALLKLGALRVSADSFRPTPAELAAAAEAVARYESIFDAHRRTQAPGSATRS